MTPEEIIAAARAAGAPDWWIGLGADGQASGPGLQWLGNFAALVAEKAAAKEREACALVCDEQFEKSTTAAGAFRADMCAAAIRARGTKEGA